MTTYVSAELLDRAQRVIDEHVVINVAGRCSACGEVEICRSRREAEAVFAAAGKLPRRQAGLAASLLWLDQRIK